MAIYIHYHGETILLWEKRLFGGKKAIILSQDYEAQVCTMNARNKDEYKETPTNISHRRFNKLYTKIKRAEKRQKLDRLDKLAEEVISLIPRYLPKI